MTEDQRRVRLIQWLETIFADVQDLLLDDHIFWAVQDVVRKNPRFEKASGLLTQWMASSFVQATATGVRRQAKTSDDSISLKRFLLEVQKYPGLVSRAHYIGLFKGREPWLIEIGEGDFDGVAGAGVPNVPPKVVEQQLEDLKRAVDGIEHYVDRRVAHFDKRGLAWPVPTFNDLSDALRMLERLVMLYWRLLKGASMTTMLLTITFDWQEILRFAWVEGKASGGQV